MTAGRVKLILAASLGLAGAAGGLTWYKYRQLSAAVRGQLEGEASKRLGRQIRFDGVSFSLLDGVTVENPCVSRAPDFAKGDFFCARRAVIKPELRSLLRSQVYFSRVRLEAPRLKVREAGGAWDFSDLLALLPETGQGLHLTWNASEVELEGGLLEADLETSGYSLALESATVRLTHFSSQGGNYGLKLSGIVKTIAGGKLLTADAALDTEVNFDVQGPASTKGTFRAANAAWGELTLEKFWLSWELFGLRKPAAEKKYAAELSASGLLVPGAGGSGLGSGVTKGLDLFAAAMGRPAPKIEDIEMKSLSAAFDLDDSKLAFRDVKLRTNFLDLDAALAIDGPAKTAEAKLDAVIGASNISMAASGPMAAPQLKPALSVTLAAKFKEALANIEGGLLKAFPVTGE